MKGLWKRWLSGAMTAGIALSQIAVFPAQAEAQEITPDFSGLGAIGSYSETQTQEIAQQIYDGLMRHEEKFTISLRKFDYVSLIYIYRAVVVGWEPGAAVSRDTSQWGLGKARYGYIDIVPDYATEDDYYDMTMQEIDRIIATVDENWSDAEKALYLHDYIALYYNYDKQGETGDLQYVPYGMLKNGIGVCEAYARLYNMLLHRLGINSAMVESVSMAHAWNLVYIGGNWYHVDITWDDANYPGHSGLVRHENFLKTTEEMLETGHTDSENWVLTYNQPVTELPSSDFYQNNFWDNCTTRIQQYQGKWLAIHNEGSTAWFDLCDYDPETGDTKITSINTLNATWPAANGSVYINNYVIPAVVNDVLYYTTPKAVYKWKDYGVYQFQLTDEQLNEGYIYGLYGEGNTLHYDVAETPNCVLVNRYTWEIPEDQQETEPETTTTSTTTTKATTTTSTTTTKATTTTSTTTTKATTTTSTTTTKATTTTSTTTTKATTTTSATTTTVPMTTTIQETTTEPPAIAFPGDVNQDDEISVLDVILIRQYLHGKVSFTQETASLADLTQDGIVNIYDWIMLKRLILAQN